MLYTHNHNNTTKKKDERRILYKICTSHFIVRVRKRLLQGFACERELETEHNCNILTSTLMAVSVVSFSFSRAAQPEAQRPTLLAFSTTFYQQRLWTPTHQRPQGPPPMGFSTTSCLLTRLTPTVWLLVFTELYNSSTPTQSPTRSLEWHVWSSSGYDTRSIFKRSLTGLNLEYSFS